MKTAFVAAAVAAAMGLGSVSAFAQDHHYDRGHSSWQHQRADRDWGRHGSYVAPHYYGRSYGYRHDNGGLAGALVLGAITGALLGQASNNYTYAAPPAYYAPPATYYNPGYGYATPSYGYSSPAYGSYYGY